MADYFDDAERVADKIARLHYSDPNIGPYSKADRDGELSALRALIANVLRQEGATFRK